LLDKSSLIKNELTAFDKKTLKKHGLTVLLVASEQNVEPLEVRPPVKVSSLGDQNLFDGLCVVDDHAFGRPQLNAVDVAVFLLTKCKWRIKKLRLCLKEAISKVHLLLCYIKHWTRTYDNI